MSKKTEQKLWPLGFIGFMSLQSIPCFARGEWLLGYAWFVWVIWFVYFIPSKRFG